ncbi:hypothetical protein Poli38472_001852 [Pythium oligandrum]|uniref:Lipoxygenase domain-containing protein n=1 Tax=Pythium oligandrum TaxID=41045 RepID=A0A8K1CTQ3_PYTOL|nr:hypothetical protein Poli38472_001852 [Pythium oligandrum]|eukprot:TMW69696.1 hypothetical protein Poli38472_001852 [Pythium oligandrum]
MIKSFATFFLALSAADALSISSRVQVNPLRAATIEHFASQIQNEPRNLTINGVDYPLYNGPVWRPDSLTMQIQQQELMKLRRFGMATPEKIARLAAQWAKDFASMDDFIAFYDDITMLQEKPFATDISDEAFGAQRLAIKGFNMRIVHPNEYITEDEDLCGTDEEVCSADLTPAKIHAVKQLSLTDDQLSEICGAGVTVANIRDQKQLFVSEFLEVSQFNDPLQKDRKYVPDVAAFFCFNKDKQQLLPVEIRLPETGLVYTPFDREDEWTLAKMAVESTEIDVQEMQHMAETHAMTIPIRVEAYRSMSDEHPVFALLLHHVFADFALEMLSANMLLNTSTEVDQTFGFGATGAVRFLYHQMTHDNVTVSLTNDLYADIERRGLDNIPTHKYVKYGKLYYAAFDKFIGSYLDVYYPTEDVLVNDVELQNWAEGCVKVPHLRGFPAKFETKEQLRKLLTHLIFQSTFKHHAMNGAASWHAVAMPYSLPALWKPLPTRKLMANESLNLMEYTIPKELVHVQILSPAMFYRALPISETLLDAYRTARFADEPQLYGPIRTFETMMRNVDTELAEHESNATQIWPSQLFRPGMLAYYTWI